MTKKDLTFPQYVREIIKDDRIARIAESLLKGKTYEQIEKDNIDIPYSFIDKNAKRLRNQNHEYNLGFLFEDWYALYKLGVPEEFLSEIVAHRESVPDIIWEDEIYSLKLRIDAKNRTITFYQSEDCKHEYEEAIKREQNYHFIFFNPKWSQKILELEINPFEDNDKIVCKPNKIIVINPKKL